MTRKLTPITQQINGYCVVVVQEETKEGKPGAFLGCLLQSSDSDENGPFLSLGEAMGKFKILTLESEFNKPYALAPDTKSLL
jgi:hypothetical protein